MKRTLNSLLCILLSLLLIAPLPPLTAMAKKAAEEDEIVWSNMNPDAVRNGPTKDAEVELDEDSDPILVRRIVTYHWNGGNGAEPGSITVCEDGEELGTFEASGIAGSGAENAYWSADVELVFYPGRTYVIEDSDPDTWSCNNASGKRGMFELYGLDPAPEDALAGTAAEEEEQEISAPGIALYLDGDELRLNGDDGKTAEPVIINGTVYVPALSLLKKLDLKARWDEAAKALYIGEEPDEEIPSHCWVLTDTVHEVSENESTTGRTWIYDYKDIEDGGRYIIDYTWDYHDEYAHYTAIGECTNIPGYLLPEEYATLDLYTYATDIVGDPGVWGIPAMGYIEYDFNEDHYATNYDRTWTNVNEDEPDYYNCGDGEFRWQVHARFPKGEEGETLQFSCQFHRGDRYPVITTFIYEWHE